MILFEFFWVTRNVPRKHADYNIVMVTTFECFAD